MTTLTATTPAFGTPYLPGPFQRPAAGQAGGAFTAQDIIRALRQRLVLILFLWIFLSGITVAGSLYWRTNFPEYEASSLIRVESLAPPNPEDPLRKESALTQADIDRELQNQAFLVRSPDVLANALTDPALRRISWFAHSEKEAKDKGERQEDLLLDILSVGPVTDSNYLRVSASWRDKTEVPVIVNVVVSQYVSLVNRRQHESVKSTKEQTAAELERAKRAYDEINKSITNFQQTAAVSDTDVAKVQENVLTLSAMATEFAMEIQSRKAQWESLQAFRPEDLPITTELQAFLNSDPILLNLQANYLAAQQQLEQAMRRYGPNHRTVKEATMNRDAAYQNFESDRAGKIIQYQARMIEQSKRNYLEYNDQYLSLSEQLKSAEAEQRDKDSKLAEYKALLDQRELARIDYEKMLEQKNMLEMIIRKDKSVQIDVASSATAPERMSSPQLVVWIPAGSFLGLMLSVGLALLLELADKSVRTPRDIGRAHLPVLGSIPSTDDDEVEIERVETACLDAPHSVVAEAFRNLRANLFFSAPAEQQGVILVTSPSGGNGKTTVAANIAISIALSGRRVLLIDANFRRSALPRIFPNVRAEGLSNILIGQGDLKDFVTQTNVPGLDILSAGPLPPNPAELLGSSYLRDVVVDARSRYDQVIFDGPPVLLVSDAMVLAGAVDGVMLVCEYRGTSRGALQRTQSNLEAINVRIFGAVLNKVQSRAGGYFRKQYREFYEYHESEDDAADARLRLDAQSLSPAKSSDADAPSPPKGGGGASAAAPAIESIPTQADETDLEAMFDAAETAKIEAQEESELEPPMAATIDEVDPEVEADLARAFRDVGESPADSGFIPDMKDVEDLDEFRIPSEDIAKIVQSPYEPPVVPDTFQVIEPPEDVGSTDLTGESASTLEDEAPETSNEDATAFDSLEDEIDLGDDLTDLDSDEFRIDDKFDLDDDFDDPGQLPPKR
ncbi:MAG: polysaccharide biosynthesis tyrosine autokinase [Planctomycetes bacterium]|nr:polysaccharide biosynthesis tyrosine autokinase [Planctomycetota bacterium]